MNRDVMFSSATDMWATPQDFFDALDREFHFALDVCATAENAKCERYFSPEQDGLAQDWARASEGGYCWCNPPYGREIGKWVRKAAESACPVVMLLPARTDTAWFHEYICGKAEVRFVRGRLKFGDARNSAPFPSMVVVFRGGEIMNDQELLRALEHLKVETGSLACLGCGYEHSCGVHGCAVLRAARERIASSTPKKGLPWWVRTKERSEA